MLQEVPSYLKHLKVCNGEIRALDVCFETQQMFVCGATDPELLVIKYNLVKNDQQTVAFVSGSRWNSKSSRRLQAPQEQGLQNLSKRETRLFWGTQQAFCLLFLWIRTSTAWCVAPLYDTDARKDHNDDVTSLDYNPKTKRIYSVSKDKLLRIWDFPEGPWAEDWMIGFGSLAESSSNRKSRSKSPSQQLIEARLGGDTFNPQGAGV